jgi:uncharacterized membrane protein
MENIKLISNFFFWIIIYTFMVALAQVLLKFGVNQIGSFGAKGVEEALQIFFLTIKNPYIIGATTLMSSSFFLWMAILSWFKLSLALPLTAITYILVAVLSYFMLDEKLALLNYFGIVLVTAGVFFLVYK